MTRELYVAARDAEARAAVAARIANDRLLLDPRTLMEGQEEEIVSAIIDKSRELQEVAKE